MQVMTWNYNSCLPYSFLCCSFYPFKVFSLKETVQRARKKGRKTQKQCFPNQMNLEAK